LQRTEIRAPIDGIVIKRAISPGQSVAVSLESKTLFKIANDLRTMEVDGKIDEADIGRVRAGQPATFTVDAYPEDQRQLLAADLAALPASSPSSANVHRAGFGRGRSSRSTIAGAGSNA